ncbi:RAP protein, putative [Plasmodium gallinaceum]|uniref:RAP protein, putative n=1 Tax=Plasmodium gallinaceum TaxID=5849 RepID=A0A1J1GME3_PLAGA|nr:RAP protein, putative [Plasmodium gallinaceum]CRG93569.1 RAP protein, putative [Plasmodium gallinaceum]
MLQRNIKSVYFFNRCKKKNVEKIVLRIKNSADHLVKEFCTNNTRYRKITVIPFDKNSIKLEYKNIPFDLDDLNQKSKKDILNIYKIIRDKNELSKFPNDFVDNLFECTKKYVRSLLPYEFVKIYKTLNIIKKNDKQLNLLLHQQIKRIYKNFDITSISKLFQIYVFTKSKPTYLIKQLSEVFMNNINDSKPWNIREIISIFCYFKIDTKEHTDLIYKKCIPHISKNIMNYTPKDITLIFYSYVKMNKQNTIISNVVTKNVILKINNYQFYQLAIILNSFSKIGEKNNKLCKVICDKIKKKIEYSKNSNNSYDSSYASNSNNLDKYKYDNHINLNKCSNNNITYNLNDSSSKRIQITNKINVCDDEVTEINEESYTAQQINLKDNKEKINEKDNLLESQILKPKDVSIILNSLIKLEYYDNETFNCLIPFIINNVSYFSPQSLSNLVHAYSHIQINNTLLLDKIVKESIMKIQKFKNIEMSNLANSLVRLNRKDKTLFTYIIDEFLYRATIGSKFLNYDFDILSLQQFAYSFSKIGLNDDKVYIILYKLLVKKINQINKKNKKCNNLIKIDEKENKKQKIEVVENTDVIPSRNNNLIMKTNMNFENNFDFFSLATFINSYGKVKIHYKNFSHFISYIIRKKKKSNEVLSNQSLSNIIYGLLKLEIKDKKIYQFLLKECIEKIDSLQPLQIVLLLYSFSKLKIYSYKFVKKSIQMLSMNINNLSLSDISLTCYSLSNFLYRDVIFLYKVNKIILLNNYEFNSKNVSQFFNSFTKLCFYHKPFYDLIFQKIQNFMHEFNEKELTNIVFSFIYYFHMKILHLNSLQDSSLNKKKTFDIKPAIEDNSNKLKNKLSEIQIENIYPINEKSDNLIDRENMKCANYINRNNKNTSNCDNKNNIFEYTNKINNNIDINEELFKNELNLFFNLIYILNEKYRQKISLISVYQLQIVDLYLRAIFSNYFQFPIYLKNFFFKCRSVKLNIDDYIILSSKTHRNISKFLNLVGISHRSEVQFGPYQLDIVVDFLQNKKKMFDVNSLENNSSDNSDNVIYKSKRLEKELVIKKENENKNVVIEKLLNKNILIEVDGISHFYKESFSRTLNSIIKDFILKKFGWNIIHIPYQEWNQCFNFKKKLLYCIHILKYILEISKEDICIKDFIHFINNNKQKESYYSKVSVNNNILDKNMYCEENVNIENINTDKINDNTLPEYYKISEETIFLNQIKNRNKHQQNIMKKLRESAKIQYNYNISCQKNDASKNQKNISNLFLKNEESDSEDDEN